MLLVLKSKSLNPSKHKGIVINVMTSIPTILSKSTLSSNSKITVRMNGIANKNSIDEKINSQIFILNLP